MTLQTTPEENKMTLQTTTEENKWIEKKRKGITLKTLFFSALLLLTMSCNNNPKANYCTNKLTWQKHTTLNIKLGDYNFSFNITKIWNEYQLRVNEWNTEIINNSGNSTYNIIADAKDCIIGRLSNEEELNEFSNQLANYWNKIFTNIQWIQLGDTTYNITFSEGFNFEIFNKTYNISSDFDWIKYTITISNWKKFNATSSSDNINSAIRDVNNKFKESIRTYTDEEFEYFQEYLYKYWQDTDNYLNSADIDFSYEKSYTEKDLNEE